MVKYIDTYIWCVYIYIFNKAICNKLNLVWPNIEQNNYTKIFCILFYLLENFVGTHWHMGKERGVFNFSTNNLFKFIIYYMKYKYIIKVHYNVNKY